MDEAEDWNDGWMRMSIKWMNEIKNLKDLLESLWEFHERFCEPSGREGGKSRQTYDDDYEKKKIKKKKEKNLY